MQVTIAGAGFDLANLQVFIGALPATSIVATPSSITATAPAGSPGSAEVRVLAGGPTERQTLIDQAVAEGVLIKLNQSKLPGCYLHRSNPNDVARTEQLTFICTRQKEDADFLSL